MRVHVRDHGDTRVAKKLIDDVGMLTRFPASMRRNPGCSERDIVVDIDQLVEEADTWLGLDEECVCRAPAESRPELELRQVAGVVENTEPARTRGNPMWHTDRADSFAAVPTN